MSQCRLKTAQRQEIELTGYRFVLAFQAAKNDVKYKPMEMLRKVGGIITLWCPVAAFQ